MECFEDDSFAEVAAATKSTSSRMFQYKLINRFLAANKYLILSELKMTDVLSAWVKPKP